MVYYISGIRLVGAVVLVILTVWIGVKAFRSDNEPSNYDHLIMEASHRNGVPEHFIKAIIRKESKFRPWQVGKKGEIGLMQITDGAVTDWVEHNKMQDPPLGRLFNPRLNIEIGAWYFANALQQWNKEYRYPEVLALAQYNAGRRYALEWAPEDKRENPLEAISFPGTKNYIKDVLHFAQEYSR